MKRTLIALLSTAMVVFTFSSTQASTYPSGFDGNNLASYLSSVLGSGSFTQIDNMDGLVGRTVRVTAIGYEADHADCLLLDENGSGSYDSGDTVLFNKDDHAAAAAVDLGDMDPLHGFGAFAEEYFDDLAFYDEDTGMFCFLNNTDNSPGNNPNTTQAYLLESGDVSLSINGHDIELPYAPATRTYIIGYNDHFGDDNHDDLILAVTAEVPVPVGIALLGSAFLILMGLRKRS